MKPKNMKKTSSVATDVSYFPLEKGYVVYQCKTEFKCVEDVRENAHEGITLLKNLKRHEPGQPIKEVEIKDRHPMLVTPEVIEYFRTHGWIQILGSDNDIYSKLAPLNDKPYTNFINETVTKENLVFVDYSRNMVFDRKDEPFATAMYFSYMDGGIDNGHYHLDRALEILKQRNDIKFLNGRNYLELESKAIRIPSYNAERYRNEYLQFIWMPSREDYVKMWNKAKSCNGMFQSKHHAVFDLDLLGLRSGGAAKYTEYYECDKESEEEREERRRYRDEYDY